MIFYPGGDFGRLRSERSAGSTTTWPPGLVERTAEQPRGRRRSTGAKPRVDMPLCYVRSFVLLIAMASNLLGYRQYGCCLTSTGKRKKCVNPGNPWDVKSMCFMGRPSGRLNRRTGNSGMKAELQSGISNLFLTGKKENSDMVLVRTCLVKYIIFHTESSWSSRFSCFSLSHPTCEPRPLHRLSTDQGRYLQANWAKAWDASRRPSERWITMQRDGASSKRAGRNQNIRFLLEQVVENIPGQEHWDRNIRLWMLSAPAAAGGGEPCTRMDM